MKQPAISRRYLQTPLIIIVIAALLLAADTAAWFHTTTRIQQRLTHLHSPDWTLTTGKIHRGGWPFGAWIDIDSPHAHSTSTLTAAWTGTRLRIGGYWPQFLNSSTPLTLSGSHALRLITPRLNATLLLEEAHLSLSPDSTLLFTTPAAQLSLQDQTFSLSTVSGRILLRPDAPPTETRLGLDITAQTLSHPTLTTTGAHLAVALTASTHPGLTSPENFDRLLLQSASATFNMSRLTAGGTLTLPALNGHLTLTLTNWPEAANHVLASPSVQNAMTPETRIFMQTLLEKVRNAPPLTTEISITNGHLSLGTENLLKALTTRQFDQSHLRE